MKTKKIGGKNASGKYSVGICQRSGFKYPYRDLVVEPGTGWLVHWSMSDGMWNLKDHPQNKSPRKKVERIGLAFPSPDKPLDGLNVLGTEGGDYIVTEQYGGYLIQI
jgi:hypothetical protein